LSLIKHKIANQDNDDKINLLNKIKQQFGQLLFDSSGHLKRDSLRQLIFSSDDKKKQLEALLHPVIFKQIQTKLTHYSYTLPEKSIVILSIPLLFEVPNNLQFNRILVIDSPIELQIARSTQRDNCDPALVKKIIASQINRQRRCSQADDIIDNSSDVKHLHNQISSLFKYYCSLT